MSKPSIASQLAAIQKQKDLLAKKEAALKAESHGKVLALIVKMAKDAGLTLAEITHAYESQKTKLESSQANDLESIQTNPDSVRANLYTNNYLSKMSNDLSSMTEDTKYSVSPLFTITMEQNRFNRDIQRDKIADIHWSAEQRRADRKELYYAQKDQLDLFLKIILNNDDIFLANFCKKNLR